MIIFDLDGSLADCEHRRHYVDPVKAGLKWWSGEIEGDAGNWTKNGVGIKWKPDWKKFFDACDEDTPIEPVIEMWNDQISYRLNKDNQIWSGRCESVRVKTEKWLKYHLLDFNPNQLKMRPIGDSTPDDELKERWLDEALESGETIDCAFDGRPKVVRMYRRRGIFVFDCNQSGKEF